MSYVRWNDKSHELLNQWAVKITSNLVARNRYADVMALMVCMNHFDLLVKQMAMSFHEINRDANEWLSIKLHVLGSDLNCQNWSDSSNDQIILSLLCEISEFITVNQLDDSDESLDFPQSLKIPASKPICVSLDF